MAKNPPGWEIIKEQHCDNFQIFSTRKSLRKNMRSGATFEFFLIEGCDWANVIPITSAHEVVFVRQYRHGADEVTLELPGGCIDPGEAAGQAVSRELLEETGYLAESFIPLGTVLANPAMMSIKCHVFLAQNVKLNGAQKLDPGENIEVVLIPLAQVPEMIRSGKLNHSLIVAAFGLYEMRRR